MLTTLLLLYEMKSCLTVILLFASVSGSVVNQRAWQNLGLTRFFKTLTQKPPVQEKEAVISPPSSVNPDCLKPVVPSFMYSSFSMPFFTFRSNPERCVIVYGVGARHGTANVFFSYESCMRTCLLAIP
uniref:BPTI/Kunitz inhibitor domain-containing protein n=1 Tax=Steinernema glaseri TaxID=37863 RepID=A0A1I7YLT6_9BILA